ncbi:hypothetical protein JCM19236_1721 [Vibrio sp. JCM 19236]|nr:hypothetical protein JCM19236_1721 [Vibrio sp. JCM 19236]
MSNKQKDLLDYNDLVLMSDFSQNTGKDIDQKVVWFAAPIIQQATCTATPLPAFQ